MVPPFSMQESQQNRGSEWFFVLDGGHLSSVDCTDLATDARAMRPCRLEVTVGLHLFG